MTELSIDHEQVGEESRCLPSGSPSVGDFYLDHWIGGIHSPPSEARSSLSKPKRKDRLHGTAALTLVRQTNAVVDHSEASRFISRHK
jgi:hypothetical protein